MISRTKSAGTAFAFGAALASAGLAGGEALAQAQQQPQRPAPQRPAQRPAQPQQPPAQQPAPQQPAQPQAGQAAETPALVYSPWTKVCGAEGPEGQKKQVCFTIKEARLDSGQFVASAGLIEVDGEPKKLLRVTLPLGLLLRQGTRMLVDSNEPMMGAYNFCLPNGCWADFEVTPEFVGRLKKGQTLTLQAFNLNAQVANFQFPLAEFAKTNEGAPTDPKELEAQQKKLQEELQRKADEARKRMQQSGGQPASPPSSQ